MTWRLAIPDGTDEPRTTTPATTGKPQTTQTLEKHRQQLGRAEASMFKRRQEAEHEMVPPAHDDRSHRSRSYDDTWTDQRLAFSGGCSRPP